MVQLHWESWVLVIPSQKVHSRAGGKGTEKGRQKRLERVPAEGNWDSFILEKAWLRNDMLEVNKIVQSVKKADRHISPSAI